MLHIPGAAEGRGEGRARCQCWAASLNPKICCWERAASQALPCQLHPVEPVIHLPDCPLAQAIGLCSPERHHLSAVPEHRASLPPHLLVSPCPLSGLEDAGLRELPGPPTGAELESSPLHATKHCVPSLTKEPGSSCASPRGSYATGGGCYPAHVSPQSLSSVTLSPSLIPRGVCSLLTSSPGAFPDKWGSSLPNRGSPSELQRPHPWCRDPALHFAIPPRPLQSLCASLATDITVCWPNCSLLPQHPILTLGRDGSLAQQPMAKCRVY